MIFFLRIQQLQLLGREMRGDVRDGLWRQLEAEILLHRHKTVVRACRGPPRQHAAPPAPSSHGQPRLINVTREKGEGLGISITVSVICESCVVRTLFIH